MLSIKAFLVFKSPVCLGNSSPVNSIVSKLSAVVGTSNVQWGRITFRLEKGDGLIFAFLYLRHFNSHVDKTRFIF